MKSKKIICALLLVVCISCICTAFAHPGRTDANGGHWNRSTGTYHYHTGEYAGNDSSSSDSDYENSYDYGYEEGYEKGYEYGYDEGHCEGHNEGYDEGYADGYDKGCEDGYKKRIEDAASENEKELEFWGVFILVIIGVVMLVKFIKRWKEQHKN